MRDPYLYLNSEVLKNLADIQDEQTLKDMKADYTLYRLSEIVTDAKWMKFDFDSLCEMHYHIFHSVLCRMRWSRDGKCGNALKNNCVQ